MSIDQPGPVRGEDAIDVLALHGWLGARVADLPADPPQVGQFPGGASNLTFLLSYPEREYVVRTPPRGRKAASSHDMAREARVLRALHGAFPVPAVVAECRDESVIGLPFYVMERIEGVILRGDLPEGLRVSETEARGLAEAMIDTLADLHALDYHDLGLGDLDRGAGYVGRQVTGWSRRYEDSRTPDAPDAQELSRWLFDHQPGDIKRCLIHNDWRLDNLLLDPLDLTAIRGVLDWEMATVGDPMMDLGGALAYWVQADDDPELQALRRQPSNLPGMPTREELVRRYCDRAGIDVEGLGTPGAPGFLFYEVFGLFRLAVIAQQIYYRYHAGQTSNPAFAQLGPAVHILIGRCRRLIDRAD